jgi:fatty acid desaturase
MRRSLLVGSLAMLMMSAAAPLALAHPLLTWLLMAVEWSALLALAVIWVWQPEVRTRRRFLRLAVALWGTTAFGIFHQMFAYMIMVGFSERDWDEPPALGTSRSQPSRSPPS